MDHFEQGLARMMRDGDEDTPYEERHQVRLRAGVRARQRARTVWMATGSLLTVAGLGVGLTLLASLSAQSGSNDPQPRPVTSAESVTGPSTARPASTAEGASLPTRTSTTTRVAATWPGSRSSGQ
ncbi:cellulase [Streptomyces sp. STR69]|uniref:cellulase n=1 Tax=Streptomyces sp. STR69 TaxID=1796942 RepID=UPI0021CA63DE|nr:cellulase [Streptomyces sp. STR69]